MPTVLPFTSDRDYTISTVLDGATYTFRIRWNDRAEVWCADIYTGALKLLIAGVPIVLGAALGAACADPERFPGMLVACDRTGAGVDAGPEDLGDRVIVYYYTAEEVGAVVPAVAGSDLLPLRIEAPGGPGA